METITTQSRGNGFVDVNQEFLLDETSRTRTVFKAAMHSGGIRGNIIRYRKDANGNREELVPVNFNSLHEDEGIKITLDKSDFVRTRLTHSIEVSTIAKQLGVMIYKGYQNHAKANDVAEFPITEDNRQQICDILMCAGLLHDLGNPPFGHFGETVIRDWFSRTVETNTLTYNEKKISDCLSEQMSLDLKNFEGNAQSIRMLTKYSGKKSNSDLNLTFAVIHTLMKYPTDSTNFSKGNSDLKKHKNGYFFAEKEHLKKITETTGTIMNGEITRHPLTFILEAADDIAYATADLEDAFKKGLFTLDQFIDFYDDELDQLAKKYGKSVEPQSKKLIDILRHAKESKLRTAEDDFTSFNDWVKEARGWLMYSAAYGFINNYHSIMTGTYKEELLFDSFHDLSIKALKKAMDKFVFHTSEILRLELSAQTIISSLLDRFVPAVMYFGNDENAKLSDVDKKYIELISDNYKNDYFDKTHDNKDESFALYLRFLMVCDFISGMTDSFAKNLYQELHGIV